MESKLEITPDVDMKELPENADNQEEQHSAHVDPVFDQDLVEAFLEMENSIELGEYLSEMDRARYKEVGYIYFQAFKQRNQYGDVKEFFKTKCEDPLNFDEAICLTTDLLLTTNRFKKVNRYCRVQILYGLSLVKKEHSDPQLSEDTQKNIGEKWREMKTDCIRQYTEVTGLDLTKEMIQDLIKHYETECQPIEAMDLIQEFELFDTEFDWKEGVKTLINSEQWDKLATLLEHKEEYLKMAIDLMSNNKLAKNAASLISKMGLDIHDYPLVLERLQKKTIRYYVYNYLKGPKGHDYMPLWKVEDLFSGYNSLMAYICEDLAFKKEKRYHVEGKALALRNGIFDQLRKDVQEKLQKVEVSEEAMKIDEIEDFFGPISSPTEEYFKLPADTNVTFIGKDEDVKLAEPLLEAPDLGVDCEWRPGLVKFNNTGVALLQIGNKTDIFLVDMIALNESEVLDELLIKVFDKSNILGMSFHNDLRELGTRCPKLKFFKKINNLYDVQPMFSSLYQQNKGMGLSKIVDHIIGQKICKVEQMANWEKRPLRKSQMHYAALDSYILVELFEKMKEKAIEEEANIEDFKNQYDIIDSCSTTSSKQPKTTQVDFDIHNKTIGNAIIRTIKLKAGQPLAPNSELVNMTPPEKYSFCVDYNLGRLTKLFNLMGFEATKITKQTNVLDRGT